MMLLGLPSCRFQAELVDGMRTYHRTPSAITTGPTAMSHRGPSERSLLEQSDVIAHDIERPVDQQRRDVGDREVARLEQFQGDQGMRGAGHPERQHRGKDDADPQSDKSEPALPVTLGAKDGAEGET